MRDSKTFMHDKVAPATAGTEIDLGSTQPGVGAMMNYSCTLTGGAASGDITFTITTSDTAGGAAAGTACAVFTLAQADVPASGNVLFTTPLPVGAKRYITSAIAGYTGGECTDGIDWGLSSGKMATQPFI